MSAKSRHPGYEPAGYGRTLLLLVLIFIVAILLLFVAINGDFKAHTVSAFPVDTTTFTEPALQIHPVADLDAYRAQEAELLNSYGWVDKGAGVARIPIDRAIDLISEQGLPARKSAQ